MDEFNNVPNNNGTNNQNQNGGYYYTPPQYTQPQHSANQPFQPVNQPRPQGNFYYPPQPSAMKPKKKKHSFVKFFLVIILVLIGIFAIAGIVYSTVETKNPDSSISQKVDEKTGNSDAQAKVESSNKAETKDKNGNYTVSGVAKENMNSCVLISVYSEATGYNYFYNYGFGGSQQDNGEATLSGEGSGVIMSESKGTTYIMTAAHVISTGDEFKVTTNDGKEYTATRVGFDSQTDIGVLAIKASGLKIASFGDSKDIEVGEQCVVIGCPGGSKFMNSVATGIVSALDRPVSSSIGYDNECIQTDAAINPGNSGGALFNMQGQVIGINSSKIASTEYEGMGFAVPSNTAVETANSLIKNGYVAGRAILGIKYNQLSNYTSANSIISALAKKGYDNANGVMVIQEIDEKSNLKGKVKQYDMIIAVDGQTMTSTDIMTNTLSKKSPGDTVKLTIATIENNQIKIKEIDCKLIENTENN